MRASNGQRVNANLFINSIISDFSLASESRISESQRIQTHLSKVLHILKESNSQLLSHSQLKKRAFLIAELTRYMQNAQFPKNHHVEGRNPVFIDENGNICAVGYLIEKTAGRSVAESISDEWKLDFVLDMKSEVVEQWCFENGLHVWEAAMIQPSYGYSIVERENGKLSTAGVVASLATTATALTVGGYQLLLEPRPKIKRWVSVVGLSAGLTSLVRGIHLRGQEDYYVPLDYDGITFNPPARFVDKTKVRLVGTVSIANGIIISGLNTYALIRKSKNVKAARNLSVQAIPIRNGGMVSARLTF